MESDIYYIVEYHYAESGKILIHKQDASSLQQAERQVFNLLEEMGLEGIYQKKSWQIETSHRDYGTEVS